MSWNLLLIFAAATVVIFLMKQSGQIASMAAIIHLKKGALVIDVRSPGEFASGHVPDAINIPLEEIETELPEKVADKNRVLLLHCASGLRSGIAQRKLKRLGYPNAFNLGSFGRAKSIVIAST